MQDGAEHTPASLRPLDWLNFFLADVQTGVGPFLAIFLASYHWNQQSIGVVLSAGGIALIVAQTPAGALVDRSHAKRTLISASAIGLAIGAVIIAFLPSLWPVLLSQILIGCASSLAAPCICAISLGIVGPRTFDYRQGRNQTFNSAGNVFAAITMGLLGYFISNRSIFFFVAISTLPTLFCVALIRPDEIDYSLARGAGASEATGQSSAVRSLLQSKAVVTFLICAVMFHFANAAMLPLLGEMLAQGKGRSSMMSMAGCVVTTQLVITLIAIWAGRAAALWGRKPLLLVAFGVLPIRGVLYTLSTDPRLLIAIQILDGVAAGIFGVVSILVIADLTRGTGRFNLAQGAIATAVGVGASLSQFIAGSIAHRAGYNTSFLFLSAIAAVALCILWLFMPETRLESSRDVE